MTFENPIWLVLAPLIGLATIGIIAVDWRTRSGLLRQFAAPRLLETLTEKASLPRVLLKSAFIVSAVSALSLALARPQLGVEWSERRARGLDIVFALDSSKSMLATDLRPTRLERAKLAILDLIHRLESDRIGLVAFAGQAFLQTPPTLDYGAFRESLQATDPSILSRGGSDLGRAIEEAAKAFPTQNNVKIVVLLTDGEDLGGEALAAARKAAAEGIKIYTIGIGTPEGEYLKMPNAQGIDEFIRDNNGQPVRSQLDESTLQQIAQLTGAEYSQLGAGALGTLYDSVLATLPREERESELQEVHIERFQWLLAAALSCLILEILIRSRRSRPANIAPLMIFCALLMPETAEASGTDSTQLFNDAYAAFTEGDYDGANRLYSEAMQQTKNRELQRDALNNMGHGSYQQGLAAYHQGDPESALEQIRKSEGYFKSASELDTGDAAIAEDAKRTQAVRETIEQLLEQQQQEEQNEQNQEQSQESSEDGEQEEQEQDQAGEQGERQDAPQEANQEQSEESSEDGRQENHSQAQESGEGAPSGQQPDEQEGESPAEEQSSDSGPPESESAEAPSAQNQSGKEDTPAEKEDPQQSGPEDEAGEEDGEQQPVPQVGEEPGGAFNEARQDAATGSQQAVQLEGMSLEEAQDLLDSLRGKEEILPFARPAPGEGRSLKDW